MANARRMAEIVEQIKSLRAQIAADGTSHRRGTPDTSLRQRDKIGALATEYQRLAEKKGTTGAMALLGQKVNWTESMLLQHRQFHDQISAQPELLEEYVQKGSPWRDVVKQLSNRARRRHHWKPDRSAPVNGFE